MQVHTEKIQHKKDKQTEQLVIGSNVNPVHPLAPIAPHPWAPSAQ